MKNYFKVTEFYKPIFILPSDVKEKIKKYHFPVLNKIREELGVPIIISKKSGYRPKEWELLKGRSGNSEHCYKGKGAVDLTCQTDKLQELWGLLKESSYTRTCMYVNQHFIHCDFKEVEEKQVFLCLDGKKWERFDSI